MAFYRGPNVVTNGLVLCLDAANTLSYVSGSTSWFDLSGNSNTGTLTNGPTFNSGNGGSIVFDGTNDYVSCGNASNLQITVGTISVWFNATNNNSGYNGLLTKQFAWGLFVTDNVLGTYDWGNNLPRNTGITVGNNTWNYAAMSFTETIGTPSNNAIIYLNGIAVLTTTIKHLRQTIEVQLGLGGAVADNQFLNGRIAQGFIYNKAFSAAEVQQNYEATKTRFGL